MSIPPTGNSVKSKNIVENQWKFYLQKSLKNICSDLLRDDLEREYIADKEKLVKVVDRRTQAPESIKHT